MGDFLRWLVAVALVAAQSISADRKVFAAEQGATGFESAGQQIVDVIVRGNAKVEADAILTILKTRKDSAFSPETVKADIRALHELGYFSDIRFFREDVPGGLKIIVQVVEKPAVVEIKFDGMNEVKPDDVKDRLQTKLYTIVSDASISADVRMIERQYIDKGFYLARVTHKIEMKAANEAVLSFVVEEGGKLRVGDVSIIGNQYFKFGDLIDKMALRPVTRASSFGSSGNYRDEDLKRDLEFLSYWYRDSGFAEVKVAKPVTVMDPDRAFVRVTFQVEEGLQYRVGKIEFSGDQLFEAKDLIEELKLKSGELFRYSLFIKDIEYLGDKYGDLGFAYAYVNPKTTFNRDQQTVDINFEVAKGEKVYFGSMQILGNSKTRDNVIRREIEVHDAELYSGTRLAESKKNINRLGFFEDVQVVKERDEQVQDQLNLTFRVKEKPTGQLQAAMGFSPGQNTTEGSFFGQGRYDEQNQSGYGWKTNFTARWNGGRNYSFETGFTNPRVNDSDWLAGASAFVKHEVRNPLEDVEIEEQRTGGSVFVGRRLFEEVRGRVTYRAERIKQQSDVYLLDRLRDPGLSSSAIFSLSRVDTNNFIDPNEGSEIELRHQFTGGDLLGGDQQFMESVLDVAKYQPLDFTDAFRTYFKLRGTVSAIYPFGDRDVPFLERYRLGGPNDLRGYDLWSLGPKISVLKSPGDTPSRLIKGGDKKVLAQLEYFIPLIPEAGIKALLFADAGRVFDDNEAFSFNAFHKDVGFGLRWITPIAPFRFEWAYPFENGQLGQPKPIFYIGY
jgi:outer membrane protein insertion porin family